MVLLLTAIGTLVFRESLNDSEMVVLAIAALVLLMRFA
jgi:hypothetical protein